MSYMNDNALELATDITK
jgi:acyl-CoA reductase-like NAD-dependent aldehyde dehydrogenase